MASMVCPRLPITSPRSGPVEAWRAGLSSSSRMSIRRERRARRHSARGARGAERRGARLLVGPLAGRRPAPDRAITARARSRRRGGRARPRRGPRSWTLDLSSPGKAALELAEGRPLRLADGLAARPSTSERPSRPPARSSSPRRGPLSSSGGGRAAGGRSRGRAARPWPRAPSPSAAAGGRSLGGVRERALRRTAGLGISRRSRAPARPSRGSSSPSRGGGRPGIG